MKTLTMIINYHLYDRGLNASTYITTIIVTVRGVPWNKSIFNIVFDVTSKRVEPSKDNIDQLNQELIIKCNNIIKELVNNKAKCLIIDPLLIDQLIEPIHTDYFFYSLAKCETVDVVKGVMVTRGVNYFNNCVCTVPSLSTIEPNKLFCRSHIQYLKDIEPIIS